MTVFNLNYNIPFTLVESVNESDGAESQFIIQGIAINATTTDNNHKFVAEELRIAANSLANRPLLSDHDDKLKSMVGKVISSEFDEGSQAIRFRARLNNTEQGKLAKQLISSGDLSTVSIGANVTSFEEEDEVIVPKGIKFKELSLVATPADDNAQFTFNGNTLSLALREAYSSLNKDNKIRKEEDMIKEETVNTESEEVKKEVETEEPKEESEESEVEANISNLTQKVDGFMTQLKAQTDLLSQLLVKQADVDEVEEVEEPAKEEAKEPAKEAPVEEANEAEVEEEEVEEDTVDEKADYNIIQGYNSFTVEKRNYR